MNSRSEIEQEILGAPVVTAGDHCRHFKISRTSLWRLRRRPGFPQPVDLGLRVPRWRLADIEARIGRRARSRNP